jgi:hypothetical protein
MNKYITSEGTQVVVTDDFRVFVKYVKVATASNRNINSVSGGKWEQKSSYTFKYMTIDQWLEQKGATPAEFRTPAIAK